MHLVPNGAPPPTTPTRENARSIMGMGVWRGVDRTAAKSGQPAPRRRPRADIRILRASPHKIKIPPQFGWQFCALLRPALGAEKDVTGACAVPNDQFASDSHLPIFLSDREEFYEPPRPSWLRRIALLMLALLVAGAATMFSLGNPVQALTDLTASLTEMTASLTDTLTARFAADPAAAPAETVADAQAPAQAATDMPGRVDPAAISIPVGGGQPDNGALLQQFQTWAAAQDAQAGPAQAAPAQEREQASAQARSADVEPVRPIQNNTQADAQPAPAPAAAPDAPAKTADNKTADDKTADETLAPPPAHLAQTRRRVHLVRNARAEIRYTRPRVIVPQNRTAHVEARPTTDARAGEQQAEQPAQSPSFLQSIGLSH
jgi:hypothetical protein